MSPANLIVWLHAQPDDAARVAGDWVEDHPDHPASIEAAWWVEVLLDDGLAGAVYRGWAPDQRHLLRGQLLAQWGRGGAHHDTTHAYLVSRCLDAAVSRIEAEYRR